MIAPTRFSVRQGDVLEVPSDLLLLKYAQSFYGADNAVKNRLVSEGLCHEKDLSPGQGEHVVIDTQGALPTKAVMFLGTPHLASFAYNEMYTFAKQAIDAIASLSIHVQVLTTTVHGTGYGLDASESLQRLVRGFSEGLQFGTRTGIERIEFLTRDDRDYRILDKAIESMRDELLFRTEQGVHGAGHTTTRAVSKELHEKRVEGNESDTGKRHVFVAMPFSEEFQNVFEYGIYPAVRNCGLICERVDETHFTGDVLQRIRERIESASLVIADLTSSRPNVYLEVGYAWGRGIPVIFVAKKGEELHFDVSTHRCMFYGKFSQFARDLEQLLRGIMSL